MKTRVSHYFKSVPVFISHFHLPIYIFTYLLYSKSYCRINFFIIFSIVFNVNIIFAAKPNSSSRSHRKPNVNIILPLALSKIFAPKPDSSSRSRRSLVGSVLAGLDSSSDILNNAKYDFLSTVFGE